MKLAEELIILIEAKSDKEIEASIRKQYGDSSVEELSKEIKYREQSAVTAHKNGNKEAEKYADTVADILIDIRKEKKGK